MPRRSEKEKQEWVLFFGANGRRQYNVLCKKCVHECKQSHRVVVCECRRYMRKKNNV